MKKLLLALALLLPTPALAGVSCSVPFNLQNGTTADASQVMANYNAIIACLANAAAAGANSDITALNGLTTPLAPGFGGTPVFIGSLGSGTGNAQVVTGTTPSPWTNTRGYTVVYVATAANTTATTLQVGTATGQVFKQVFAKLPGPLTGGEIATNQLIVAIWDGTEFQLENPGSISAASLTVTDQNLQGGAFVTSNNLGSLSGGGTLTVDCGLSPLQYFTNAGNYTIAAPVHDGSCMVEVINGGSAGALSFSGFTVNSNTGEPLTTTNTNKFIINISEINGVATYFIKALQ